MFHSSMAISKSALLFLLICSLPLLGASPPEVTQPLGVDVGGGGAVSLPCVQKLLPCQAYLKSPGTPPASCCLPMRELVVKDSGCLCQVFNDPTLLKGLNVTQEDGLNLARACGAKTDTSRCSGGVSPAATPGKPTGPSVKRSGASSKILISQSGLYISLVALILPLF